LTGMVQVKTMNQSTIKSTTDNNTKYNYKSVLY